MRLKPFAHYFSAANVTLAGNQQMKVLSIGYK
jgi:hypothetical protein